jgi:LacI family transcriptional regulator
VAALRQGNDRVTIYSVADRAGVSIASVSRVLQGSTLVTEKTRSKVLSAVDELNYVPLGAARSLAVRRHEAQGLVLPELNGPYFAELLMGFETRAAELGQSVVLLLAEGKQDLLGAVRQLATRVDGIAVMGSSQLAAAIEQGLGGGQPVVLIAGGAQAGIEAVGAENHDSALSLTAHLMDVHGRRRLLFVGDPGSAADVMDRYAGFAAAVRARAGLAPAPVRIAFREKDGALFAERLLAGDFDPDALVCANDELALAIMARLQDAGRSIPADLAVVGWDDVMTARYVRPALTTVRQPVRALGSLAADRLHARLTGASPPVAQHLLPTDVILRSSCGCPEQPASRHTPRRQSPFPPTKEKQS